MDLLGYETLNRGQVKKLWGTDRASLRECGLRHYYLNKFYVERDKALIGQK